MPNIETKQVTKGIKVLIFFVLFLTAVFSYNIGKKIISNTSPYLLYERAVVSVGNANLVTYLVADKGDRAEGLGKKPPLPQDHGMLFLFDESDHHGIWMKNMQFAIDIVWISGNTVVDIKENVTPETYPDIFYPKKESDYILEVNGGFVKSNKIKIGDKIEFIAN